MTHSHFLFSFALGACLAVVSGCSSSDQAKAAGASHAGPDASGVGTGGNGSGGAGGVSAGGNTATSTGGTSPIPVGACNHLTLVPGQPLVNVMHATGPAPVQTGGSIVDGTYYLTAFTIYDQATSGPTGIIEQGTWVISGGVSHLEALFPGVVALPDGGDTAASAPLSGSNTLVPPASGDTTLVESDGCRGGRLFPGPNGAWPYTASGYVLTLIPQVSHGGNVATFTKQP